MSDFNISIVAGKNAESSSVKVTGHEEHVITNAEKRAFQLNDLQLKEAIEKYFGKRPNNAYLSSPTPWRLYEKYHWQQTQTVLVCTGAEILNVSSDPVILETETITNNGSIDINFDVAIGESVINLSSSTWSTGGIFTVREKMRYKIDFIGTGETSLSYTKSWEEEGTNAKLFSLGSSSSVIINLKPGQSVEAILSASRGVMHVRIHYNSYLTGKTAVNYSQKYQGYQFHAFSTASVMSNIGVPNSIESTEDIEICYYSNGKVEIQDKETGEIVLTHSL